MRSIFVGRSREPCPSRHQARSPLLRQCSPKCLHIISDDTGRNQLARSDRCIGTCRRAAWTSRAWISRTRRVTLHMHSYTVPCNAGFVLVRWEAKKHPYTLRFLVAAILSPKAVSDAVTQPQHVSHCVACYANEAAVYTGVPFGYAVECVAA